MQRKMQAGQTACPIILTVLITSCIKKKTYSHVIFVNISRPTGQPDQNFVFARHKRELWTCIHQMHRYPSGSMHAAMHISEAGADFDTYTYINYS